MSAEIAYSELVLGAEMLAVAIVQRWGDAATNPRLQAERSLQSLRESSLIFANLSPTPKLPDYLTSASGERPVRLVAVPIEEPSGFGKMEIGDTAIVASVAPRVGEVAALWFEGRQRPLFRQLLRFSADGAWGIFGRDPEVCEPPALPDAPVVQCGTVEDVHGPPRWRRPHELL